MGARRAPRRQETSLQTTIDLLGSFRLSRDGAALIDQGWNRRKALTLLKLVALAPSGRVHREQVCEVLWPDLDPRAAANNLHKNLHHLRTTLGAAGVTDEILTLHGDMVQLAEDVSVDLHRVRAEAEDARGGGNLAACERVLDVLGRGLLPEDAYEDWVVEVRSELSSLRADLLREVAALHIGASNWDAAIDRTAELLEIEPADEDAHRALMQLYVQTGSRHRALRQFELCRDVLREQLGVDPSPRTVELRATLLEDPPAADSTPGEMLALPDAPPRDEAPTVPAEPAPVTYGRGRELETIEGVLDDLAAGSGAVVLLLGEAGIGKSHLLRHVAAAAGDLGILALSGRAYEFDAHVPYQPLRDMLRELSVSAEGKTVGPLLERSMYVRRLLPGAPVEALPAMDAADLQSELFEEFWRLFSAVAETRPLALLFDDLHDADESTLRLVHLLARRAREAPILVFAAAGSEQSGGRGSFAALRADLRRDRASVELELQPLDDHAVGLIARESFDGERVEAQLMTDVIERSGGVPFFARELANAFIDDGSARFERGQWRRRTGARAPVPLAARDLLERRLEQISDHGRTLLNVAAVAASVSRFRTLQAASGIEHRDALDALDECISAMLIEESDDGYRFRHDLVREAAYGALTSARRQQLHLSVAEALLESSRAADPGVISHHLSESDEPWRAVPYLLESGRRAESVFAHDQARRSLERAVELCREHDGAVDDDIAGEAFEALGDLERRLGDLGASVAMFEEAAFRFTALGSHDAAARARGKAALGHIIRGDAATAQQQIEETLRGLSEQSSQHIVSRTYYLLSQLHWHSGEHQEALEAARQALLAAQDGTDPQQEAQAYEVLALACHSLGDWQQGIEYELNRQALGVSGFDADEAFDAHL